MTFYDISVRYKPVDGFPGYYIAENGDVYSTRPLKGRKDAGRLHKIKPCYPKNPQKYPTVKLCNDGRVYTFSIHRLVAEHFVPGRFDGAVVNHIDGNPKNNRADNLEWTTIKDNVRKSYITSGVGSVRNYMVWSLYDPDKNLIGKFIGGNELSKFISENNLDVSASMLIKWKQNRGYTVIVDQKSEAVTTIREE